MSLKIDRTYPPANLMLSLFAGQIDRVAKVQKTIPPFPFLARRNYFFVLPEKLVILGLFSI
jgi:hypothetical protein